MTEQEYIDTTDYQRVANAITILDEIVPKNSEVIHPTDHQYVIQTLREWRKKLHERIKAKD